MNITKNVLNDLLPAYLSGEASPDTTSLIEEFMRTDAAFANEVHAQRRELTTQIRTLRASKATPGTDHELQTLSRTRAMLERRKWLLAIALMFTVFPCSFVFDGGEIRFLLFRDQPTLAIACWVAAAGFWIGLLCMRRRLKSSGL
jgi:anti-sigma factor RsiW